MRLARYRFIHWDTAPGILIRNVKDLNYDQKKQIEKFFDSGEYYLVESYEKKNENGLWRLTYPLFFITMLLSSIIIQPIKWLITGKYYFSSRTKIFRVLDKWEKKL